MYPSNLLLQSSVTNGDNLPFFTHKGILLNLWLKYGNMKRKELDGGLNFQIIIIKIFFCTRAFFPLGILAWLFEKNQDLEMMLWNHLTDEKSEHWASLLLRKNPYVDDIHPSGCESKFLYPITDQVSKEFSEQIGSEHSEYNSHWLLRSSARVKAISLFQN